tara:strand:+ start:367 stop:741 length:375 start_codon:yes stop_codon:yes gene_type:complete
MAYIVRQIYTRPNTSVDWPKISDFDADLHTERLTDYSDRSITIGYSLSEDELTLTAEINAPDAATWNAHKALVEDATGNGSALKKSNWDAVTAAIKSDCTTKGISYTIQKIDDGTPGTLVEHNT